MHSQNSGDIDRTKKSLMDSYDEIYKRAPLKESKEHYRWVARTLDPESNGRLLDIACGGGYFLAEVEKKGLDVYGLDFSEVALQIAQNETERANLICGDGEALPFKENSFDYVVNLGSLEHFLSPKRGILEMTRVLKKDGKALILLPNSYFLMTIWNVFRKGSTERVTDQKVDRWATKQEWVQLIEGNGLRVVDVMKYNYRSPRAPLKYKIIRPFIPMNLSYCFLFICRKF